MIQVFVVDFSRKHFVLRWKDSAGKLHHESSGCTRRRDAERKAADKEKELNAVEWSDDGSILWETFRERFDAEHLSGLAPGSKKESRGAMTLIEKHLRPQILRDINSQALSRFVSLRRTKDEVSEDTIKKNLRHIGAVLRWAVEFKYLPACPSVPKIRRAHKSKEAKGRPVTPEEFDAMLGAVAAQVGNAAEASWKFLLRGLWLSGLRLGEAMQLRWERGPWISIDIADPARPVLIVPGKRQKSGEEQRLPLTADFGAFLAEIDPEQRSGFVFAPIGAKGRRANADSDVGRTISAIGKSAGVLVDESREKFASAHDLRRSFGARWSTEVMPAVLKELMRHASIETTMKFYVGQSIERTHDAVLAAMQRKSNIPGNSETDDAT